MTGNLNWNLFWWFCETIKAYALAPDMSRIECNNWMSKKDIKGCNWMMQFLNGICSSCSVLPYLHIVVKFIIINSWKAMSRLLVQNE